VAVVVEHLAAVEEEEGTWLEARVAMPRLVHQVAMVHQEVVVHLVVVAGEVVVAAVVAGGLEEALAVDFQVAAVAVVTARWEVKMVPAGRSDTAAWAGRRWFPHHTAPPLHACAMLSAAFAAFVGCTLRSCWMH
jgi:hypothetical protein